MAIQILSYPLNSTKYTAEDAQLYTVTRTSGVYSADADFAVDPVLDQPVTVSVSPGIAWIKYDRFGGMVCANRATDRLQLQPAHSTLTRIDRIIIRYDVADNNVVLDVKPGIPSSAPVGTALQRDVTAWELAVAEVTVTPDTVTLTSANIRDTRLDEELCGLMGDGVTRIPSQQLYNEWRAWLDSVKATLTDDVAMNLFNLATVAKETSERAIELALNPYPTDWQLLQEYKTAGTYTWRAPDIYGDGKPYQIGVFIVAGGGSGAAAAAVGSSNVYIGASGASSGYTRNSIINATPNNTYAVVVGIGGAAVTATNAVTSGNNGGTSSFNGVVALGGRGGRAGTTAPIYGMAGGQGSDWVSPEIPFEARDSFNLDSNYQTAPAMGRTEILLPTRTSSTLFSSGGTTPSLCFNQFDGKFYLGAGGGAIAFIPISGSLSSSAQTAPTLDDGLRAGAGAASTTANITAQSATSPGSGGGSAACVATSGTRVATSGRGADGAVFIYTRRPVR